MNFIDRVKRLDRNVLFFLIALGFVGAGAGIFNTTFNNFLADTYDISAGTRGMLEFPRELPGLLVTVFAGLLAFLPETRVGGIALLATSLGFMGLSAVGFIDDSTTGWPIMILCMFLWSVGNHLVMPIRESIGMSLGNAHNRGRKLGQVRTVGAFAAIGGAAIVWVTMAAFEHPPYWLTFGIGGLFALTASILLMRIKKVGVQTQRRRLIVRKKYWIYYVLSLLFGARKQIFLTFAPWVLVRIFHQPPATFAQLWIVSSALSLVFIPAVGVLIDRLGERAVLMVDSCIIIVICGVYGYAYMWGITGLGLWITFACFVLDQLLFSVQMARSTYISKIATNPDHVPASISLGVTLDHVMGMSVPVLGGFIWMQFGHQWVFVGAAGIAVMMVIVSALIRVPREEMPPVA